LARHPSERWKFPSTAEWLVIHLDLQLVVLGSWLLVNSKINGTSPPQPLDAASISPASQGRRPNQEPTTRNRPYTCFAIVRAAQHPDPT
jgi:hypothetical protein